MSAPYIPPRDADLDVWLANFSTLITAGPATYGLVSGDATTIAAAVLAWHTAFLAATGGSTRGPMTISAKDDQKVLVLAVARPYAQQVANNAAVAVDDKIALRLNPRTTTPTPVPTPVTQPVILLAGGMPLQHELRYRDATSIPSVKAKPAGAVQLLVYAAPSATLITDPAVLPFVQPATKSPLIVSWDSSERGKTVYYAGRWMTRTGLLGPWSTITHAVLM